MILSRAIDFCIFLILKHLIFSQDFQSLENSDSESASWPEELEEAREVVISESVATFSITDLNYD